MRFMHWHKTALMAGKKVKGRVLGAQYVVRGKNYWWLLNPFHAAVLSRKRRLKAKGAREGGKTILNSEFRSLATLTFLSFEFKIAECFQQTAFSLLLPLMTEKTPVLGWMVFGQGSHTIR